jgi:hypothetical protein
MVMIKISTAEFVAQVRARATDPPPRNIDPVVVLWVKAQEETLEGRTVAKALAGIIRGNDFDEADVFALSHTTLGWLAAFAERWSLGIYSEREVDELMRGLELRACAGPNRELGDMP